MYKYESMALIIRDYLAKFEGQEKPVRLTVKDARKLDGMDIYAQNQCSNNVGRAMEYVLDNYYGGSQVSGTERGKGNSTYAIDYDVRKKL